MRSGTPVFSRFLKMRLSTWIALVFAVLLALALALTSLLAYRSATEAVKAEIERGFAQRHALIAHLIAGRLEVLDVHLADAARNPLFFKALGRAQAADEELLFLLDSTAGQHLDLLFALDEENRLILDAGSPLFPVEPLLPAVSGQKRGYLQGWRVVHTPEVTAILRANAMINPANGRVEGYLFGGVSLSKNPPLTRFLTRESGVESLAFYYDGFPVAAYPAPPVADLQALGEGDVFHAGNLYSSWRGLVLTGRQTPLKVLLAVDDRSYEQLKRDHLLNFLLIGALLLPFFIIAVMLIRRSAERGARHLTAYAQAVGQSGERSARFVPTGIEEYDRLGDSFVNMVRKLGQQRRTVQKLFDGAAGPVIIWNEGLEITRINKAAAAFFDRDIESAVGLKVTDLFKGTQPDGAAEVLSRSVTSAEGFYEIECAHPAADGALRYAIWNITAIAGPEDSVASVIAQGQEITGLKETQAALLKARDAAEAASLAKSRFLANMSHELRTPLNAIMGYSEMLLEEDAELSERMKTDLRRIHQSGRHLLFLIGDVLDIASVEAGKVELDCRPVRLTEIMRTLESLLEGTLKKSANRFECDLPDELFVQADTQKLTQVLYHVLSNAFKFTQNGTVSLRAWQEENRVVIEVQDSGIGMSEQQLAHLFTPFWQADDSSTRRFGGSGLGLALARKFIQMMNGSIGAQSVPGKGSCFTITLPIP